MMATGKTLVPLRPFIMLIWGSQRSQCLISGSFLQPIKLYTVNFVLCSTVSFTFTFLATVYDVNMVLNLNCSFYDRSSPIYTQPRYLPPSKMLDADVTDSVIGEGCVIKVSYTRTKTGSLNRVS